MTLKQLLLIPGLSVACLLSACAGPMPKPDPGMAWIGLRDEAPNDMLAERVDGKRIDDGRFFEVTPGAHDLAVTLFEIPSGDSNQQDCQGEVRYNQFKAGEHYTLVESSLGQEVSARLEDSHGQQVAQTGDFRCMPG
ncbi:hypothetical protein C1Y08_10295 [Pseudomonas sp. FW306-02-F02-AA]|jgi:hypothetical protein|uniref:Lipoprotein n=1 Tax=Pseudomonas fluorescens TaxID=294 RepID=A0A0N9WI38_PSEFL|nr:MULTISPECIES: hypothetical protein [Pseudomonas]ALI02867.1 hypothetical protein AO353_17915 [Pseudomonas fluorescens]PMZ04299.1 hypothetical protein C1Y07_10205 [Pseudomonas sp. FW306-02-F02-AB]PMZ10617.1 hypothetical protein C1Y06_07735 [Pseudomonas sp. FW306-02-H06C]PMZ16011.1 hypothetical protein C1Y08_10295 [Pseudomonas sp. FW306-02-F02-AA]PMZ21939.1 hypothetical protein C1Y09_10840 [Pseudomonas sp. FW306-02-F08-AA]